MLWWSGHCARSLRQLLNISEECKLLGVDLVSLKQNVFAQLRGISLTKHFPLSHALLVHLRDLGDCLGIAIDLPQISPAEILEEFPLSIRSHPPELSLNGPNDYAAILTSLPRGDAGDEHLPVGN
jgi:hypothetical protein